VQNGGFRERLLAEILRDAHRYTPGIEPLRPSNAGPSKAPARRLLRAGRERARDQLERAASRLGFSQRHFDPDYAAAQLARVLALSEGLEKTYGKLADARSRQAMVDLLKLRVLGPFHASLPVTPERYRSKQAYVEKHLRVREGTFDVPDPLFSPLSLYRVSGGNGRHIMLHSHSVDIVSVFLLGQYGYSRGAHRLCAETGDVVLDAGGCWGDTALYFASRIGPNGRVYTFEFDPQNVEVLHANLALNPELAERIEIVELALWDRSGETVEYAQAGRMTNVVVAPAPAAGRNVRTITIDDFVSERGIERAGFVKMDVEGAELRVLAGARDLVGRLRPRLAIAAYHQEDDLVRIPEALDSLAPGYRLYLDTYSPVEEETVLYAAPGA
jgi:FkbM family methyltransferase